MMEVVDDDFAAMGDEEFAAQLADQIKGEPKEEEDEKGEFQGLAEAV